MILNQVKIIEDLVHKFLLSIKLLNLLYDKINLIYNLLMNN